MRRRSPCKVDAVIAFDYTSVFNLVGNGVKLDDIVIYYFSTMGYGMFSNLVHLPSGRSWRKIRSWVRRVAAATAEAWVYGATHRQEATDEVCKREKLLDPSVELQRLSWIYDKHILTPNVKQNGLGAIDIWPSYQEGDRIDQRGFRFPRRRASTKFTMDASCRR